METAVALGVAAALLHGTAFVLVYFDRKNGRARWRDEISTLADFYKIR